MKSKIAKILLIIIIFVVLNLILNQSINAAWSPDWSKLDSESATNINNSLYSIMGSVITIVEIVGVGIALIMLLVIGIKFVCSAPEGRAELKKTLMPYLIGAIILFSAAAILRIIQQFATGINSSVIGSDEGTDGVATILVKLATKMIGGI